MSRAGRAARRRSARARCCRPCARWPGRSSASAGAADYAQDVRKLNPVHVIVAGIIGAALFVLALVLLVHWVVGSGVAA